MWGIKRQPITREGRVLRLLKERGDLGAHGYELSKYSVGGHRFGTAIAVLRRDHSITTIRLSKGDFKYYLNEEIK